MVRNEDILSILEAMGTNVEPGRLKVDAPLVSQGFDSLDMATLMFEIETKFNVSMPPEKTAKLRTVEQITDYLNQS